MYDDTIAAIATPIGEGGIGVIRVSGKEAKPIASRVFSRALEHRRLSYGEVRDPEDGSLVDEVMVTYMQAPRSYTREDMVEVYGHGGPVALQRILKTLLRCGARPANPGEFTLRAFLNGRIDLAQAEAVLDVIRAKTDAGLRIAIDGLQGRLSEPLKALRKDLMELLAYLTARIDFPEDDVQAQDALTPLRKAREDIAQLIASADTGIIYRQGVRVAIVGSPNVGKSSLLNRLLGQSRAIVTPIPGTTRDTVEEVVNIQGIPFVLVDTAGITDTADVVENLGIERSRDAVARSDLVLLVLDLSQPLTEEDTAIMEQVENRSAGSRWGRSVVAVANKCDLPAEMTLNELPWEPVRTSMVTGEGLEGLQEKMVEAVLEGRAVTSDALLVSNPRHKAALERAQEHLAQADESLVRGMPDDFVTIDLTAALNALGEITGETVTEELLETIFSRFCIGK
ncbi:MAG: tRNA uridine-5-carboxymethylaminomethyl(34) synthesis GTPase MnmE [Dehalococcoidia bacterium]